MSKLFETLFLRNDSSRAEQILQSVQQTDSEYLFFLSETDKTFPDDVIHELAVLCKKNKTVIGSLIAKQKTSLPELTVFPLVSWKKAYLYLPAISPLLSGKLIRTDCLKKISGNLQLTPCPDFMVLHHLAEQNISVLETAEPVSPDFNAFNSNWKKQKEWLAGQTDCALHETMYVMECQAVRMALQMNLQVSDFPDTMEQESLLYILQNNAPEKIRKCKILPAEKQKRKVRKIAVFCLALRTGGAERCAALMLNEWSKRNDLELTLFASSERQEKDYAVPENVRYVVLSKHFAERMAQEEVFLQQYDIDTCIYFDHCMITTFYDIALANHLGIRTVAMEHNTYSYCYYCGHPELSGIRDFIYKQTDMVTCLSRADEFFWNRHGIHAVYMPNPLTFSPETITPHKLTEKSLIFIGRMLPEKGFADALIVTAEVRKKHPDVKLYMLGAFTVTEYREQLDSLIEKYHLENNVEVVGFTTDIQKYIRQSSIHLMPSMVEGYPMTVMEVKAFGVPTVLYSMPYLEAAKEEYGAISVPKQNPMAMAEVVTRLFDDFDALNALGKTARESLAYFSNDLVYRRWNAVFESLETGLEPEMLSVPEVTPQKQMEIMCLEEQEIQDGLSHMFHNDEFREKMTECVTKQLEQEYPVLNLSFRLHRFLSPEIGNNKVLQNLFNAGIRVFIIFRKLIRMIVPRKDEEHDL